MNFGQPRPIPAVMVALLFLVHAPHVFAEENQQNFNPQPSCNADRSNWTMGLVYCDEGAVGGYTLFSPIPSNTTYLIDHEGRHVHDWVSPGGHRPGLSAYLLPDGDLLRTANNQEQAVGNFSGGGTSGKIERISWNGTLEWSWRYDDNLHISHHDIEPMPNGNILLIAWEERTEEEALQAGRNPAIASDSPGGQNNVWPDRVVEVKPIGTDEAEIVWQWNAWDHLIQDYDETKDNYGVVADHPGRIDINFVGASGNAAGRADWMHCNGIDYNAELDQIALSCRSMNEVYVIDHSTTTEEAAGQIGGNAGKGGDILYRWGNPQVYKKGLSSDQQLFAQHDVQWIEAGHPDEGKLIVFNNGNGRYPAYSSVDIIDPQVDNGTYVLQSNGTFGPASPSWSWNNGEAMYSAFISGAQALTNGNVLVTHGTQGTLYEVSREGNIVWEYIAPIGSDGPFTQGDTLPDGNRAGTTANTVFKATSYSKEFVHSLGQTIAVGDYLENWSDACPNQDAWGWDRDGDGCIDDSDGDGTLDPEDQCPSGSDFIDEDDDGVPDACDALVDNDADGVANQNDACEGHDDTVDADQDGVPEPCDDLVDSDGDGMSDDLDRCPGHNDSVDEDLDGIADGCDPLIDTDGDGVSDDNDVCVGGDDKLDADQDSVPDHCDTTTSSLQENATQPDAPLTEPTNPAVNQVEDDANTVTQENTTGYLVGGMLLLAAFTWWLRRSKR
tara:strand:+ start:13522 stop:15693 length:2172 start_codon:yes stop_codon:yes gene_type:complete